MKYLVVSVILFFCTLQTFCQQEYFVYFQTDNNQAFYIRINENIYSSTSSGYLILSKLPDNTAIVTIGFAKNVYPEQQFNIPVNHKDAGYLLKNFGDKGWGLFNLQTLAVLMNNNPAAEKKSPEITGDRKTDAFSMLLANAVNDTAVLYTINKPRKPAQVIATTTAEEKHADSSLLPTPPTAVTDSIAFVKKAPIKKDSILVLKKSMRTGKDSLKVATTKHAPVIKTTGNKVKSKPTPGDTTLVAKTPARLPVLLDTVSRTTTTAGNHQQIATRDSKPVKESVAGSTKPGAAPKTIIAVKNPTERRDTIIMMPGKPSKDTKVIAKNSAAKRTDKPPTGLHKPIVLTPEKDPAAKINAVPETPAPVAIQKTSIKKDSTPAFAEPATSVITPTLVDTAVNLLDKQNNDIAPVKRLRPLVTKAAELLTDTSYVAVFVDESKDVFDTIRISIPFNEYVARTRQQDAPVTLPAVKPAVSKERIQVPPDSTTRDSTVIVPNDARADSAGKTPGQTAINNNITTTAHQKDSALSITELPVKTDSAKKLTPAIIPAKDSSSALQPGGAVVKKDTVLATGDSGKPAAIPLSLPNSDCKQIAWDSDVDKLRIKMLLVVSDDDRIAVAKKVYSKKCFSVKQVKALSELFKNDEGRYKWFDAVYPYVSDSGNFSALGDLIKTDYYLNRFKAMLRN
ncbi:MAG: DUF4476 domain-containing protein [Chitinophagaceae bacterium]